MPYGITINCTTVSIGGLLGAVSRDYFPNKLKGALPGVFGLSAITMGVILIVELESFSAVILAVILGTVIGELMSLEISLMRGLHSLESRFPLSLDGKQLDVLISMIVLFCFGGIGIFGVMNSAMTGDHSILIAKAITDFFIAVIFDITAGYLVGSVAISQPVVGVLLFGHAGYVLPYIIGTTLANLEACGGIITLAMGFKTADTKKSRVLSILSVIVLVLPFSTFL